MELLTVFDQLFAGIALKNAELSVPFPVIYLSISLVTAFVFLEHSVSIDSAETEGVDPCPPRGIWSTMNPWPGFGIDVKWSFFDLQTWIGLLAMEGRRQYLVVECEGNLDETSNARRRNEVTNHRLYRSDGTSGGISISQTKNSS